LTNFSFDVDSHNETNNSNYFGDLSVSFGNDAAMADLLSELVKADGIGAMRIEGVTGGGINQAGKVVYKLTFTDLLVSNIVDDEGPGYSATFDYTQIGLQTFGVKTNGTTVATGSFGFDRATGTAVAPPDVASGTGTAVPDSGVSDYYLI